MSTTEPPDLFNRPPPPANPPRPPRGCRQGRPVKPPPPAVPDARAVDALTRQFRQLDKAATSVALLALDVGELAAAADHLTEGVRLLGRWLDGRRPDDS